MRLRRLDSEIVRDQILAVSGQLDCAMGGQPVLIDAKPDGMVVVAKEKLTKASDSSRRSVYILTRRAYNLSLLTVFDQPLIATNCLCRDTSAVPLQSLAMLNDSFVDEQSEHLGQRIEQYSGSPARERILMAFRMVLVREPDQNEIVWCEELFNEQTRIFEATGKDASAARHQALVQVCHTLFNTSEFLYAE